MFGFLPVELVEQILLYLSVTDILSTFSAFNEKYNVLSNYFWKKICHREDFFPAYYNQEWYECFQSSMNKKLGCFTQLYNVPRGILEHVYLKTLITRDESKCENIYRIYNVTNENTFVLAKEIQSQCIWFKDEFIIVQNEHIVLIYKYNNAPEINGYEPYKTLHENINNIFGISNQYCTAYNPGKKIFNLHKFHENTQTVDLPSDVKFLINKFFNYGQIAISFVSLNEGYKIKVCDIITCSWILDLICFGSTGITNDPNIWFGSHFIGCCDVSYRLRGIYFGPFKVWNKKGNLLFQTDIEPSNKHYLRCFFLEDTILLTTSDNKVNIFNSIGESVSSFSLSNSFTDIKLTSGHLLLVLEERTNSVNIYDWSLCIQLYSIKLHMQWCTKAINSDFLYCPVDSDNNTFQVIKFF